MNNETENKTEIKQLPTETQIAAWKKQHGAIYEINVGDKSLFIRKPKIVDLERAMASDPTKKKPFNFNRSIVTNCKLWVSEGMLDDDDCLEAIYEKIGDIAETVDATIKKH